MHLWCRVECVETSLLSGICSPCIAATTQQCAGNIAMCLFASDFFCKMVNVSLVRDDVDA